MNLLTNLPELIQGASLALTAITLVATLLVRIVPNKNAGIYVSQWTSAWMGILHWLPTIGINPQTKKLEDAILALKADATVTVVTPVSIGTPTVVVTPVEPS